MVKCSWISNTQDSAMKERKRSRETWFLTSVLTRWLPTSMTGSRPTQPRGWRRRGFRESTSQSNRSFTTSWVRKLTFGAASLEKEVERKRPRRSSWPQWETPSDSRTCRKACKDTSSQWMKRRLGWILPCAPGRGWCRREWSLTQKAQ